MPIILTIVSIFILVGLFSAANRLLPFKICSLCAGVSMTWLLISAGILSGWLEAEAWKPVAALAMGGSAVGIGYQGERRFLWAKENIFLLRLPATLAGFTLAYFALQYLNWFVFAAEIFAVVILAYLYFVMPSGKSRHQPLNPDDQKKIAELEKKMEKCC